VSDATIFADNTPGNVANNSSARRIGKTLPAMDGELDNDGDEFAGPGNGVSVCLTVEHDNLSVARHRLDVCHDVDCTCTTTRHYNRPASRTGHSTLNFGAH
jgi:hypothetical protein